MKGLSKKESEVLLRIFKDFNNEYNANSISKVVNITPRGALKILKNLAKGNLVIGKKLGKAVFYNVNFQDEYAIKIIETLLINEAREKAQRWIYEFKNLFGHAEIVIIFGSILKNYKKANDIDLLIVFKKEKRNELDRIIQEKQEISDKTIHIIRQSCNDLKNSLNNKNTVIINVLKRGYVLYGADVLSKILKDVKSN